MFFILICGNLGVEKVVLKFLNFEKGEVRMHQMTKLVNGIFEMFSLGNVSRSGWHRAGVKSGIENVLEHTCLTAQIAYILAIMEEYQNPEKIACEALFHDNAETRMGDLNKLNTKYLSKSPGERIAFTHFISQFPSEVEKRLCRYFDDFETGYSKESILVKDADLLQMGFQAKIYLDQGHKFAQRFLDRIPEGLKTDSAKMIFAEMLNVEFFEWCLSESYE